MRKNELVSVVADKANLSSQKANNVIDIIFAEITHALSREDAVSLPGFGCFSQRHRRARAGRSPKTGEPIAIPASNSVGFKPGKALKDAVNP